MIYTVTFNPALDYTMKVNNLQTGEINRADSEQMNYGGKGINVSAILSRLKTENKALGFIAGFSGDKLAEMLNADGIDNDFVKLNNGFTRINVKIKSDNETDINANGPDIHKEDLEKLFEKLDALKQGDYLVLAGSIPKSLPDNIYENILERLKNRNIKFVIDATGDLLLNVLHFKPFLIKPNHHELGELFDVKIKEYDDIVKYSKLLQEKGAENVLVSCGKKGAVLLDSQGNTYKIGNVPGKIISSVGCGDSMVAGFVAGYIEKVDYAYALKLGAACGNATAFSQSLATKEEIDAMLVNKHLGEDFNENC